jgi:serine/threonine protein kinase/formylglycine-generating enzyme required for sulfatase activity
MSQPNPQHEVSPPPWLIPLLEEACDRFETALRAGESPRIDVLLEQMPEEGRPALLRELLVLELAYWRLGSGSDRPALEDYLARFPAREEVVRAVFRTLGSADSTLGFHALVDLAAPSICPEWIGRYRIERLVGQGGFGLVYVAQDEQLNRPVAIKVPHARLISRPEDAQAYLHEARIVANLDHPHIVPVYDVGSTPPFPCFVVSKFIDGENLAERIRRERPATEQAAELVATVAEALHHAHARGVFHRDVKPANILIDSSGQPFVSDFGLALKDENFGVGARRAGTPAYMSPEQARGENHRVDRRSDIFSLGVVFYELLTGQRPFRTESLPALLDQIASEDPHPPRQLDHAVPRELERICLKALAKRATERYSTAKALAEDLRFFLADKESLAYSSLTRHRGGSPSGPNGEPAPSPEPAVSSSSDRSAVKVVPRGLRSFDERDAEFFLELLPGPRDRQGLPRSIQFWRDFIEETDPNQTFPVGLIYGPSGCGKSSLVRAGLLPRLQRRVLRVYVEATSSETETRLARGLRKVCPDLATDLDLPAAILALRTRSLLRSEQKVLLIVDQFEQWLHAHRGEQDAELIRALRQCDGEHVQAIVLVRDEFWMAATRFMAALEFRLLEGENSAAVDRFDQAHARRVLAAFGRAYGRLPERRSELTTDQEVFLDQVVAGLSDDGHVIPVRLALFAELVKAKPWIPSSLRQGGGIAGLGVMFLEETFSSRAAPPEHRVHEKAAQAVLKALLPETGSDIKGRMRSREDLLEASGYVQRPREFDALLRILDGELRLITPTDPEGVGKDEGGRMKDEGGTTEERMKDESGRMKGQNAAADGSGSSSILHSSSFSQLTHDYLVPALREWLARKQRETRRGRAAWRLAERAALWNGKPENRLLPSALEWTTIQLLTRGEDWTASERRMMKRAARFHGLRALGLTILLGLASWVGIEAFGNLRAIERVERLRTADTISMPALIDQLRTYRRWAGRHLRGLLASTEPDSAAHLRASLASLALFPDDRRQADYLLDRLLAASTADLPVISRILREHHPQTANRLWPVLIDANCNADQRFRAACALASTDAESAPVAERWDGVAPLITDQFLKTVDQNPSDYATLIKTFRPFQKRLLRPMKQVFLDSGRSERDRTFAMTVLADYGSLDPGLVADLLMDAGPEAYARFFPLAKRHAAQVLPALRGELEKRLTSEPEDARDQLAQRQARAAIALVRLGRAEEVWPRLNHSPDPRLRSFIVNWLSALGADPKLIDTELARLASRASRTGHPAPRAPKMDDILFDPETSIQRSLILALGTYETAALSAGEAESVIRRLLDLYRNHPDSGVHGAAAWALRQWKRDDALKAADVALSRLEDQDRVECRWYINRQGETFAIIEGPAEFRMGSPPTEAGRIAENETSHRRVIPHRFAIAAREVSVEAYQRFARENPQFALQRFYLDHYTPGPDGAMISVSWFRAAAYCNWRSKQEGLARDQWCYLPNEQGMYDNGMTIPDDVSQRRGYRLPTEAEWEYACRAGAVTSRYYGASVELLVKYAWYVGNSSADRTRSCGSFLPNDLGLFDMLGNVLEWCQDKFESNYQPGAVELPISGVINSNAPRVLRGGAFTTSATFARSANRASNEPTVRYVGHGFRLARTYP